MARNKRQNDNLNKLRQQALILHKRAGAKISREKRANGYSISGTPEDPRRSPADIRKMRTRDVNALINRLQTFNTTPTQNYRADDGSLIPRADWKRYQRAESRQRRMAENDLKAVANKRLPGFDDGRGGKHPGPRIADFAAQRMPQHMGDRNAANGTFVAMKRKPGQISSAAKLQAMTEAMERRNTAEYRAERSKASREEMLAMINFTGNTEHAKQAEKLTDYQLHVLWNYTEFADLNSRNYINEMELADNNKPKEQFRVNMRVQDDTRIGELLAWGRRIKQPKAGN